jgi:hypothetical protein
MLPPEWKKEIEEAVNKRNESDAENEKGRIESQNAIVAPLDRLAHEFKGYRKEARRAEKGKKNRDCVTIIGLFLTALFTLALAAFSIFQTYAFIQSERAFVFPTHTEFVKLATDEISQPIILNLTLNNHGKSVATIRIVRAFVTKEPLMGDVNFEGGIERAFSPIPAQGNITQDLNFGNWSKTDAGNVRDGIEPFHILGRIIYGDDYSVLRDRDWAPAFLKDRLSYFCFVYVHNKSDPSKATFQICPEPKYTHTQ